MNNKIALLAAVVVSTVVLTGCNGGYDDSIRDFCATQRKQPGVKPAPLPPITPFTPMKFEPKTDRMPFVIPKPEISQAPTAKPLNCEQPDRERPMEELEQYSLDNLFMRGTVMTEGTLKALIQTADGTITRVVPGMHMGLNFGKVIRVAPDSVEVEEFVSDGKGCWDKRSSRLDLMVAE